jgi:hypothetical protein
MVRSAKVHPRGTVVVNYIEYWSEMLQDPSIYNSTVPVRYDPLDASTIWVQAHNAWVECHSREYSRLKDVSVPRLKSAAQELRKKHKSTRTLNQKQLTELLDKEGKGAS